MILFNFTCNRLILQSKLIRCFWQDLLRHMCITQVSVGENLYPVSPRNFSSFFIVIVKILSTMLIQLF